MRGIVRRARDRRGDHGLGTLLRNNDRRIAGPTDSSGATAARHLRIAAHDRRPVPLLALDDGRWRHGDFHRQVLERAEQCLDVFDGGCLG